MGSLSVEVVGKFGFKDDANKLLYAPITSAATFRKSRVYQLQFDGDEGEAKPLLIVAWLTNMLMKFYLIKILTFMNINFILIMA